MRWRIAAFLLTGFACQLQTASTASLAKSESSTDMDYDVAGKGPIGWSGGALFAVEAQSSILPVVRLFGRDGIQLAALAVNIPDARIVGVYSVARGSNGLVAIAGGAGYSEGRTTDFIALYPADGSVRKVIPIPVDIYHPNAIAVAADGSVWTAGIPQKNASDHNVFWHFDSLGNKIGSAVSATMLPGSLALRSALFAASPQGLVWVCPRDGRYLELSLDGDVTNDVTVKFPSTTSIVTGLTVTEDGQRFVQVQSKQPRQITIYSIDKKSGDLAVLANSPDFHLVGADGNNLVGVTSRRIVSVSIVP